MRVRLRLLLLAALLYSSPQATAMLPIEQTLAQVPDNTILRIAGSNTLGGELLPTLMQRYFSAKGLADVSIQATDVTNEVQVIGFTQNGRQVMATIAAHGSGTGFSGLAAGQTDLAAASRPIKPTEQALFAGQDMTRSAYEHIVGIDGLAIIVHPDLPISHIDLASLAKVFAGEIDNWQALQPLVPEAVMPNLPISIHARDYNSGTYDSFASMVMADGYTLNEQAQRYESNEVLSQAVASQPGAIGFTALATIGDAKALAVRDHDSIAMAPEPLLIAAEDYPLSRRLYLYRHASDNPHVGEFLRFSASQAGQQLVEQVGFISQNIITLPQSVYSDMPLGYRRVVGRAERLSVNFRFRPGQHQLDNKALADLLRLQAFMNQRENQGRELLLFGFSGDSQDEQRALLESKVATLLVRRALRNVGITSQAMNGYGSINPVSNQPHRNSRVEVWLKE